MPVSYLRPGYTTTDLGIRVGNLIDVVNKQELLIEGLIQMHKAPERPASEARAPESTQEERPAYLNLLKSDIFTRMSARCELQLGGAGDDKRCKQQYIPCRVASCPLLRG